MSIEDINNNPQMVKIWMDNEMVAAQHYFKENPNSLILNFENELRCLGYDFEVNSQIVGYMPKHKKTILPIAMKYYMLAKEQQKFNEQDYFIKFFGFKGFDEVIPQLLVDYHSKEIPNLTRWFISDCFYKIRSKNYVNEYLDIVSNSTFGQNRQMIILLLGKIKEERAIPILINLLEDEEVRLHAISALGEFKKEEFRCYFEKFQNSTHPGWRKYARGALKKLG